MQRLNPQWLRSGAPRTRLQLAVVLLGIVSTILLAKLWEEAQIAAMRKDMRSMLDDRLVPQFILFNMMDEMHTRRIVLDEFLSTTSEQDAPDVRYVLGTHEARLENLLEKFEQTYLVEDEAVHLAALRMALKHYAEAESAALRRQASGERVRYDGAMQQRFDAAREQLLRLSGVQQKVGEQLDAHLAASASRVTSMLYFQVGVAFILGLIAAALAASLGRPAAPKPKAEAAPSKAKAPPPDSPLH